MFCWNGHTFGHLGCLALTTFFVNHKFTQCSTMNMSSFLASKNSFRSSLLFWCTSPSLISVNFTEIKNFGSFKILSTLIGNMLDYFQCFGRYTDLSGGHVWIQIHKPFKKCMFCNLPVWARCIFKTHGHVYQHIAVNMFCPHVYLSGQKVAHVWATNVPYRLYYAWV